MFGQFPLQSRFVKGGAVKKGTPMAKGQMRSNKEKKKPKAEHNKKKKGGPAMPAGAAIQSPGRFGSKKG
jgi:hypothetical protein